MRYRKTKVAGKTKYVHRVIVEQRVGRALERHEIVHHENEDKLDNADQNLVVTDPVAHGRHHHPPINPIEKPCSICCTPFRPVQPHRKRDCTCSRPCRAAQIMVSRLKGREFSVHALRQSIAGGMSYREAGRRAGITHHSAKRIYLLPQPLADAVAGLLAKE